MKKILSFSLCFICAATIANAQAKQNNKPSERKENTNIYKSNIPLNTSTIIGVFTIPKSVGSLGSTTDFMSYVKSRAMLISYKMENGQLTDRKEIPIANITVDNTTRANLPNYTFTYQIKAIVPYNQPIDVAFYTVDWSLSSGKCLFLSKTDQNEYATFSASNKTHTGFDFSGSASLHPH
ncbi:hypothetical protein [Niabella drilacis]|uniref:DUF3124 domain-containing protein n=1 Tax=Niabella drilacis (strain DSM 25811 / CCM 8410 / CCUG 62505 / LMG 26954 / E90) TaxID=1285928 RepID=A0A1G6WJG7_NIADE|nr:hypothetical protein [Niabella drilacis]SDD65948.1 hypothetical protein SAMN04487894_111153 [Niabella drilacis]